MMERLMQVRSERHQVAREWKRQTGKKVIGVFCCDVPEELIYAAGMLPVRILGSHEEATEGDLHFPTNVCPYPKSCLDQALKGHYDYLDGVVVPNVCDMIRAMYGAWKLNAGIPYVHFLEVPQRISPHGVEFFRQALVQFQGLLEEISGNSISSESLRDAIDVYNRNRSLLREACELRGKRLLSGVELQEMVISSMLMPKEEHNQLMSLYLEEVRQRSPATDGVRIFISASMLDDTDFLELIEECGGSIVADDMPMGSRYFFHSVDSAEEPLLALAQRYLNRIPCPRKMLPQDRYHYIQETMAGFDVQGAIIHNLKACDCHLYEYPYLKEKLEAQGLPVLFFRGEETEAELETQRDDIEAFIEMLRG
ncbi:MAG: 2-hydroxyacyl-CoA dehydratase family protein [Chloroflexota bacterium]|nr:2-hydroxyacyl-CoA dehydratase family protein [Chloroflexota bacterium]